MDIILKQKIKKKIAKMGLLPTAYFLKQILPLWDAKKIYRSFKFYFYNYWITNLPNHSIRVFYLKHLMGIPIGDKSFIHMGCFFYPNVKIGNNSVIGRSCHLLGEITIKNNVSITAQTYIFSSSHHKDSQIFECYSEPVTIEDYAWIGARAMILPGVKIGKGAILGSASTATKSIPDYTVFAGSPAKEVGKRNEGLIYNLNYFPYFE